MNASSSAETQQKPQPKGPSAREINDTIRYTMWSAFKASRSNGRTPVGSGAAREVLDTLAGYPADDDLVVRGWYDVAGLRADADLLVWWHAPAIETLQRAYRDLLGSSLGQVLEPVWSQVALHRPAEFNKGHVPAFMAGEPARGYVCVYPFVRSLDWYLLPDADRRKMLADHGMAARTYPDVRANTVPAFALGDYEWILAFEADDLYRIVDLMRDLRATEARRHVRVEVPFFTGPRVELTDFVARLK